MSKKKKYSSYSTKLKRQRPNGYAREYRREKKKLLVLDFDLIKYFPCNNRKKKKKMEGGRRKMYFRTNHSSILSTDTPFPRSHTPNTHTHTFFEILLMNIFESG